MPKYFLYLVSKLPKEVSSYSLISWFISLIYCVIFLLQFGQMYSSLLFSTIFSISMGSLLPQYGHFQNRNVRIINAISILSPSAIIITFIEIVGIKILIKLIGTDKYKQVKEIFLTLFKNLIVLITILPPFLLLTLNMMSKLFYAYFITFYSSVRSFVLFFP